MANTVCKINDKWYLIFSVKQDIKLYKLEIFQVRKDCFNWDDQSKIHGEGESAIV